MLNQFARGADRVFRRYTPDPYIFALGLTLLVLVLGPVVTGTSVAKMVGYWGDGFWNLIPFSMQMVMILVGGYVVATSKPVRRGLYWIAGLAQKGPQSVGLTALVSCAASYINWGFGLVVGALFCREVIRRHPASNYRLLVASAYGGFLLWHAGLSGSVPLAMASKGNFSEKLIGKLIGVEHTLFSSFNLFCVAVVGLLVPLTAYLLARTEKSSEKFLIHEKAPAKRTSAKLTPAEKIENSAVLGVLVGTIGLFYLVTLISSGKFKLDLNRINFAFLFFGMILHARPAAFLASVLEAAKKAGPILIQFPFFAGIMAMMIQSGLAAQLSEAFVAISTKGTFPLFTFYSAGLLNLFVPSGGGQWAVQAPLIVPAAQALGVDVARAGMAVAWGDAWTNLLQPFWALPLLAIAGLHLRDIMGYCVTFLVVTGTALSILFLAA